MDKTSTKKVMPRTNADRIVTLLEDNGQMSANEIAAALKIVRESIDSSLLLLRNCEPKEVFVSEWKRKGDTPTGQLYAMFSAGIKKCATKPSGNAYDESIHRSRGAKIPLPMTADPATRLAVWYNTPTGEIQGYQTAINDRVALCMLLRGR